MVERVAVLAALLVVLASCGADGPEPTNGSTPAGGSLADGAASIQSPRDDTAAAAPSHADPQPGARLLTPDGWGPLRIGMSRSDVVAAAGEDANPGAVGGPDPEQCDEFRPAHAPTGVLVMIEGGVLTRISVSRKMDIETPAGFRVGDPGEAVLDEYGPVAQVEQHRYWPPPASYITVWRRGPSDAVRRGIRYEIGADGIIAHLRAGGPSIEYVEGCA